ncbi:MAG: ABC transporter permease [Thermoanaerobaculia bacterium]
MESTLKQTPEEGYFGHQHLTVIQPTRGWRALDLRELWAYRELLWVLALRDIQVRYKQTALGASWAILRPLLTMLIFTVVFGRFAKIPSDGIPYSIFVFAGLMPWTYFASAVASSGASLVGSANLVSKVYFPRLIVPLSAIGASLVDLLVSAGVLFILMAWYGVGWSANLLAAPFLVLAVTFTALGVGVLLAAITVTYRDVNHLLPFLIQTWLYVTPVIYPSSLVPERLRPLLDLNPMTGLIEAFRSAFLGRPFDVRSLAISLGISLALFGVGVAYFERVERRFADVI